jgi:ketosteroid isomerase-like protein
MAVNLRHIQEIVIVLLIGILAVRPQNSTAQTTDSGAPQSGRVEELLMQMERDWGKAILERDVAKIRQILSPDVVLATPDGTVQSLDDDLTELQSGGFSTELYDSFDMRVKLYGDCAVVTGKTTLRGKYKGEDVQDEFRWTDTFVRRNGRWQIVASQATTLPQAEQK